MKPVVALQLDLGAVIQLGQGAEYRLPFAWSGHTKHIEVYAIVRDDDGSEPTVFAFASEGALLRLEVV